MNADFLARYNDELRYMRDMSGQFARMYPKIAGRLLLAADGKDVCPDPFVERMLEGFAFLSARVQHKFEAQMPKFAQSILDTVFPDYLSPTPAACICMFEPEYSDGGLKDGVLLKRHSYLRSQIGVRDRTACIFRTASDLTLLPLKIKSAKYHTRDISALKLPSEYSAAAALCLNFEVTAGLAAEKIKLEKLNIHLPGANGINDLMLMQIFEKCTGVIFDNGTFPDRNLKFFPKTAIKRYGFAENESILPERTGSFSGHRILREYFICPERFSFFLLDAIAGALDGFKASSFKIILLFSGAEARLEDKIESENFALHCVPVVNLFEKTLDRVDISKNKAEYHLIPDKTRMLDYEIFSVQNVEAVGESIETHRVVRPFYMMRDGAEKNNFFYNLNRVRRTLSSLEVSHGAKSSYIGSEVYISLVDSENAACCGSYKELSVKALCTNRHLPISMPLSLKSSDFSMLESAPVNRLKVLGQLTVPVEPFLDGGRMWRLVSMLNLNYLMLTDTSAGANAFRELLRLFADYGSEHLKNIIAGILSVKTSPVVMPARDVSKMVFARGLQVNLHIDEDVFEGIGPYILSMVLDVFMSAYVGINSFTKLSVSSEKSNGFLFNANTRGGSKCLV